MASLKEMRRDLEKMQVIHLMEDEWIEKYPGLTYDEKINLADSILAKQSFGHIDDAKIIKIFKDQIRSQKKVVQSQKKAFQQKKQSKLNAETAMRQARQDVAKLMSQTSSKIVKAPVVTSSGESKESIPVARVLRGPTKIPKTKKKKSTGCFGRLCKKDDAEGGGKRKTRRKRKHKKRKRKRKTRRRKKRTKKKTRKKRR